MHPRRRYFGIPTLGQAAVAPGPSVARDALFFLPASNPSGYRAAPITAGRNYDPKQGSVLTPDSPTFKDIERDYTRLYPWLFPPRQARPFAASPSAVTVAPATTVNLLTLADLTGTLLLPRGANAKIERFANDSTDFTNLTWTFLINGHPAPPIVAIVFQWAPLNQPSPIPGNGTILESGEDFVVQVTNTGVAPITGVRARVEGYLWRSDQ